MDERVAAEELDASLARTDEAEQHPQRRRLAGAVRPEIAEDVARLDGQVDVVDRDELAVALDQGARRDGRGIRHANALAASSASPLVIDPPTTMETPPLSNASTVPSGVASSCADRAPSDTFGRPASPAGRPLSALADSEERPRVVQLAVREMPHSGKPAELLAAAGIDAEHIAEAARQLVGAAVSA